MIAGLTGTNCSGKDTAANYFMKKGFIHISLSDLLREELVKNNIEVTRDNLISFGRKFREEFGNDFLARRAISRFESSRNYVITSIRHPDEVRLLKKINNFILVNIDASVQVRFSRMSKRQRAGDPKSLSEFIAAEERELVGVGTSQQISKCQQMADHTVTNDSDNVEDLENKLESFIS